MQHMPRNGARGVWAELKKRHESNTRASKAHTRSMLHKCQLAPGEPFDLYRSRILALVQRLRNMGETVSDGEMIYALLEGLPREYEAITQALQVQDELNFDEHAAHIRDHQERMGYKLLMHEEQGGKRNMMHMMSATQAYMAKSAGAASTVPESAWVCRLCKQTGHWERKCHKRRGTGMACFKCGVDGHQMKECPDKGVVALHAAAVASRMGIIAL